MKFSTVTSLALCAALTSAAETTSLDVAAALSSFYPSATLSLAPAQSTSLAAALVSVASSWENSPEYTSAYEAIISAAPSSLQASISSSGYNVEEFTTEAWYTKSVPKAIQTAVVSEINALDQAAFKIVGTPTSSSKGGAAKTAAPIFGAMVVGGLVGMF